MRIVKTAISLFIAMILSDYLFKRFLPDLDTNSVCVFAMLSVQDSVKGTWKFVLERLFGNVLGMATGFLLLFLFSITGTTGTGGHIINGNFVFYVFVAAGTMLAIYLCKMIDRATVSAITIIVFLGIMFGASAPNPYLKGAMTAVQMAIGIAVAVTVNMLIMPPKAKKNSAAPAAQQNEIKPCGRNCEDCRQMTLESYAGDLNNVGDLHESNTQGGDGGKAGE